MDQHFLTPLLSPRSVVVFAGATDPAQIGFPLARTLIRALGDSAFDGRITFLDNAMSGTLGELAHSRADLAIIALPPHAADAAPGSESPIAAALEIAGRIRCRAALVLSSALPAPESALLHDIARRHGMHLLGPNSLGFQRPFMKLNASLAGPLARPGALALVSQSGALTTALLDWAAHNRVGFSSVVSLGPNTAVDLPQVLDFLANDAATQSILIYMEGIHHARRFMSALRAAAAIKPVVVMKAGRQAAGAGVALTHSAAIVGSDDVFEAALRRAGVVRVRSFTQLFSAARCLASRYRPVGQRLAVVTNGGGPGVLAADRIGELGLKLAALPAEQRASLAVDGEQTLAHTDPRLAGAIVDLGEDATPDEYRAALSACASSAEVDGVLVIYAPKPDTDSDAIAQAVLEVARRVGKPVLTSWLGDERVRAGRELLSAQSLPSFRTPEAAVDAFHSIASFHQNQLLLQQTPPPLSDAQQPDAEGARLLIEGVLAERRQVLTEMESKALLAAFHIPVTRTMLARSANEAMLIASQLGYAVALKIDSPDISHKSDVQGVALGVASAVQVRDVYNDMLAAVARAQPGARINGVTLQPMAGKPRGRELYIGVSTDVPFGPVITFGAGGTMIELIADRAMELPPLNQYLARRLIERARAAVTLGDWRGCPPADMAALEQVLLRVSEMVCALPQLREMDINPIIVDERGAVAVDARIVVGHGSAANAPGDGLGAAQPYHHLAILPYPAHMEREWPLKGGGVYTVRPIRPDDAEMLQTFTRDLSEESRYFRFVSAMHELPARMLSRFTLIDYDREMALVAVHRERHPAADGQFSETERIIGVSRYITNPDQSSCEFSLVVADDFAGQGLGSRLMRLLMDFARAKGLSRIEGLVLTHNDGMLKLMRGLGYTVQAFEEDPDFRLVTRSL